jgi:phosphocarrier protein
MKKFTVTVSKIEGGILHVRTAGLLMKEASQYVSDIIVSKNDKTANAKDILAWMGLNVSIGDVLEISVKGPDEDVAVTAFEAFLAKQF